MIQEIRSFEQYEGFISELAEDPLYSDPHFIYDRDNLYGSIDRKDEYAFAVTENGTTEGIFVWLVIPDEQFIEMLIGFTRKEDTFAEMLSYMEKNWPGYQMDFVFNPQNPAVARVLERKGAAFEPEQQKMVFTGPAPDVSTNGVELLSEKWEKQYCGLHRTDVYWTAERILSAQDRFRTLVAIKDGRVQGYIDVTYSYDENEIYDLFVKLEAAQEGYGLALLAKAAELNGPHQMMVLVDADAGEDIALYTAAGFTKVEGQNSVFAQIPKA